MPIRAALIWNPVAGRRARQRRQVVDSIAAALRAGGWTLEVVSTAAPEHALQAARSAAAVGCGVIVGCGGDGTLHEIINGMMAAPAAMRPALGIVPFGTANILAHALGVPTAAKATAALLRARPEPRPLGRAQTSIGSRWFAAVASVGLDARVVHLMDRKTKRSWGKLAYAASAVRQAGLYFPAPLTIESPGSVVTPADGLILGLSQFYGGRLRLGEVSPGDSIALALSAGSGPLFWQSAALLSVGLEHAPGVTRLSGTRFRIPTPERPVELDGEPAGFTPAEFSITADALRILSLES